jgi:NADPH-dependent 2,4-dienoyl-CoA reductase/sulfur reductase-like enzyme
MHHVIVGNSIAGVEAALAIRRRDAAARITLLGAESARPFARTALMYVLADQLRWVDTEFVDPEWATRFAVELRQARVDTVDAARQRLNLEGGATLDYDRLLLAVGSVGRRLAVPGGDDPAVHRFVTRGDLEAVKMAAKPGSRCAVIGGGLIGVEVAEALHSLGVHVTWLVREPWTGPVMLDRAEAEGVEAHVRTQGVDVRTGVTATGLRREGAQLHAEGVGAPLVVDFVVAAIGVVPNTAFLAGSGVALTAEGGIDTRDDLASTSAPNVWAAGDCATVTWADGSRRPETLWYTARDQGRMAGAAMAGEPGVYRRGVWTNSARFFDVEYTTAGFVPVASPAGRTHPGGGRWQTWFHRMPGEPATLRIVLKDDRVVGFNALGRRWDTATWLRWVQERRPLEFVLAHLAEASFEEELTPPFRAPAGVHLHEGA